MLRLAVVFRRPLHEIADWPAHEVDLLEAFMAREPAADQRLEIAMARMCSLMVALWGDPKAAKPALKDFLPYLDAWPDPSDEKRYSDVDREVLSALGVKP